MNIVRLLLAMFVLAGALAARALEAGAAKERLIPPPGATLDGDASRLGRSATGEHDPLWVRCLYLSDGNQPVFLLNLDVYRITSSLRASIVKKASAFAPAEAVIVTATHTPNGPGGMSKDLLDRWYAGRWNAEVLEVISDAAVASMQTALEQKRRATVGYGFSRPRNLSVNALDPKGPVDEQVGVIRVDDADGKAIAIATCFSAAPLAVPAGDTNRFSAGYAGAYYRKMEELTDPGCVAMFLMGAGGDQSIGNPENVDGWERLESIGGLLAISSKSAANDMTFHDAALDVSYREFDVPSLMGSGKSEVAPIQTLKIDDLLLTFLPGLPGVETGLGLRRDALARGYATQFTVGLANGYLGYISPLSTYGVSRSPAAMQRFGPQFESWLRSAAMAVALDEAEPDFEARAPEDERVSRTEPGHIRLQGTGFDQGYQRGVAFKAEIDARLQDRLESPVRRGEIRPAGSYWGLWPGFLDSTPLVLPALGMAIRPLLPAYTDPIFEEIQGLARATGLSFDSVWVLENASLIAATHDAPGLELAPSGTMFGALGSMAAGGVPYIALDVAWNLPGAPVISEIQPDRGRNYAQIGLNWQTGAVAGLNDAGVAIGLERNDVLGTPELTGVPASQLIRQVLQTTSTFEEALKALQNATHLRGFQVVLIGPGAEGWRGAALHYGKRVESRTMEDGLLLGVDPETESANPEAEDRYRHLVVQMQGYEAVSVEESLDALSLLDRAEDAVSRGVVVLRPGTRTVSAGFAPGAGDPGSISDVRLKESLNHE